MRKCKCSTWKRNPTTGRPESVELCGTWLAWGVNYEELPGGIGAYSAGIVEMSDGKVELFPADLITFADRLADSPTPAEGGDKQ
jgi:hypothetical protein